MVRSKTPLFAGPDVYAWGNGSFIVRWSYPFPPTQDFPVTEGADTETVSSSVRETPALSNHAWPRSLSRASRDKSPLSGISFNIVSLRVGWHEGRFNMKTGGKP